MNFTKSIPVLALLAATLNAVMLDANAQPVADSVGASSQMHGELVTTPAGIVPAAASASADAASDSAPVAALGDTARPMRADSTGGSSAARAAFLLEHARDASTAVGQLASRGQFQPYPDSTGGSSATRRARAIASPVDALRDRGPSLASK